MTTLQQWLGALRSGQIEQGRGYLNDHGKMCCLGVFCDLKGVEWHGLDPEYLGPFSYEGDYDSWDAMPDPDVRIEIASLIDFNVPDWVEGSDGDAADVCDYLALLNDGNLNVKSPGRPDFEFIQPHSFSEIADWIEAHAR